MTDILNNAVAAPAKIEPSYDRLIADLTKALESAQAGYKAEALEYLRLAIGDANALKHRSEKDAAAMQEHSVASAIFIALNKNRI